MSEWNEVRLGELIDINPETLSISKYNGRIQYIDISSVNCGQLDGYTEYDISDAPSRARRIIRNNDIIYSTVRPNLRAYYYVKDCPDNAICSTGFAVLRAKDNVNSRFVYSLVTENSFVDYLSLVAKGSTYPAADTADFKKAKVTVPDLPTQNRIADILSGYDDLIENNNRRIALLEKAAQELYKEWFVRFRFPGHETTKFENGFPEGWNRVKMSDFIEFNPTVKATNQNEYKIIPMAALNTTTMLIDDSSFEKAGKLSGSRSCNGDTLLARITPCLENGKTGFVQCLDANEVAGGSTEFIVMRGKQFSPFIVYFIARDSVFRDAAIASMNGADGRQRVKVDKLKKLQWIKPCMEIVCLFDNLVAPQFKLIHELYTANQNLAKQRDLLLPRLLSGKLEA